MRFSLLWKVLREFLVKRLILLEFFFDVENLGENFFCAALLVTNLWWIFPFQAICKTICLYTWIIKQFYDGILTGDLG